MAIITRMPTSANCIPGFLTNDDPPTPAPPSKPTPKPDHSLIDNFEFIQDLARYGEGLFTREQVKRRWRKLISNEMWDTLGSNDELVDRIEAEKVRRIRDGSCKRERAQLLVADKPQILSDIATNPKSNAKHRVDAIKVLDSLTGNPAEAEQRDRVVITIRLDKDEPPLVIDAAVKPNTIDVTPQEEPPRRAITDYSDE